MAASAAERFPQRRNLDQDEPCGRYLSFRQLIAFGKTQARTGLANQPRRP